MLVNAKLDLGQIFKAYKLRIGFTWFLVVLENSMLALVPYLIGTTIDDLLAGGLAGLLYLGLALSIFTVVAVLRRFYDTRTYGTIRVNLGSELNHRYGAMPVSSRNARLDMSRELVDFLEIQMPEVLTGIIQIVVALIILAVFHPYLLYSALITTLAMFALYALFHQRFYRFNAALNGQMEQQVGILEGGVAKRIVKHLRSLRGWEVRISDTEAVLYGVIFLMVIVFILFNLWFGTNLPSVTTGNIYAIVSYSWSFVEAAFILPMSLQSLTRLQEITQRINRAD